MKVLPADVYAVARTGATEEAFTGKYWDYDGVGTYYCAVCGNPLFRSDAKFSSSCGWPSFFEPVRQNSALYRPDTSYGMNRREVLCGRCGSHLGHLFDDGPPPHGKTVLYEFYRTRIRAGPGCGKGCSPTTVSNRRIIGSNQQLGNQLLRRKSSLDGGHLGGSMAVDCQLRKGTADGITIVIGRARQPEAVRRALTVSDRRPRLGNVPRDQ